MSTIKLTDREKNILRLIVCECKCSAEVAEELGTTAETISTEIDTLYEKLNVSNRVQAFRRATALNLL